MATTRVGFLRAVNVGRRTVAMATLRDVCAALGYEGAWTFVNSGNVVFEARGSRPAIESELERALADELGFECTTFVRSAAELRAALRIEPFTLQPGDTYFITFLKAPPAKQVASALEHASNDFDTLVVHGRDVHWHMRGKSTDTKLRPAVWRQLGEHASTSRNVNMLTKLVAKLDT
jgi:uncharacterized protein (DUF1697 family)